MQVFGRLMWKWLYGSHLAKKVDMLSTYATALAYSFVLSIVPLLVVAFALTYELIGSVNGRAYHEALVSVLPVGDQEITRIIKAVETSWRSNLAKTLGPIFAVYTSFNLMNQIVRTLIFIFDDARRPYEWSLRLVIKTVSLLAIWTFLLLAIIVSSILTWAVNSTEHFWLGPWRVASDLVMVAALFTALFLTFYLVPNKRPRWRDVRDGALVASLCWIVCGLCFSSLQKYLHSVNMVYQALGSVVIILLWAQACAWSLIIGACWMVRFAARGGRSR
jgi:membrane protein